MKINKEKVKKYLKEHKKEIVRAGVIAGSVTLGYIIGYKQWKNYIGDGVIVPDSPLANHLLDAQKKYKGCAAVCNVINGEGFKPSELGKLGEAAVGLGAPHDQTFTHFIAIGKQMES